MTRWSNSRLHPPDGRQSRGLDRRGADVVLRAQGPYLWTEAGRRFIDHFLAEGAVLIGHTDPRVDLPVIDTLQRVDQSMLASAPQEGQLTQRIVKSVPSAEEVRMMTTGAAAMRQALLISRSATRRSKVMVFSGQDWAPLDRPGRQALFRSNEVEANKEPPDLVCLEWNDLAGVREALKTSANRFAAVFVQPYQHGYTSTPPVSGFLESLRELTTAHGVVLVFDETQTGFRHHLGGYQAVSGVTPDLTLLGGGMGNGYPIAALAGRSDLMGLFDPSEIGEGENRVSPHAVAAALATFGVLETGGVARLRDLGERLRKGLSAVIEETKISATVTGLGPSWSVHWRPSPPRSPAEALEADMRRASSWRSAMHDAGILLAPFAPSDNSICVAFGPRDVEETLDAARDAFARVA